MKFIFEHYSFDPKKYEAIFTYSHDNGQKFTEVVSFAYGADVSKFTLEEWDILDHALFLAFVLIGTSYWKAFPAREVQLPVDIDHWQAGFFNKAYQDGMSQFAFENQLRRDDLAHFAASGKSNESLGRPQHFRGDGLLVLQSGGKDSLLVAHLLEKAGYDQYTPWHISSVYGHFPEVLDRLSEPMTTATRTIDGEALSEASQRGALNGHVPVTYIIEALAIIQAILLRKDSIVTALGDEADEPHTHVGDLAINHQWSKTWNAEVLLSQYVHRYISPDIHIGSPIRPFSELRIAELFSDMAWERFGEGFSSCNRSNYTQGNMDEELHWCGKCSKCANSYLLFAPFISSYNLQALFGGKDLFQDPELTTTFKGLLGIDGEMKPFECVAETGELRKAYEMIDFGEGYAPLPFAVPHSNFDYKSMHDYQIWAYELVQGALPK
jgi:hypothetical protein